MPIRVLYESELICLMAGLAQFSSCIPKNRTCHLPRSVTSATESHNSMATRYTAESTPGSPGPLKTFQQIFPTCMQESKLLGENDRP